MDKSIPPCLFSNSFVYPDKRMFISVLPKACSYAYSPCLLDLQLRVCKVESPERIAGCRKRRSRCWPDTAHFPV